MLRDYSIHPFNSVAILAAGKSLYGFIFSVKKVREIFRTSMFQNSNTHTRIFG